MNAAEPDPRGAILDAALEQELRGERPPDLVDRVLAAAQPIVVSTPAATPRGRPRWLSAALALLAFALVVVVWSQADPGARSANWTDPRDPVPMHADLIVPSSIDEALRLIDLADRIEATVFAVRDPQSGRLVPVKAHPFENLLSPLFGPGLPEASVEVEEAARAQWTALTRDALQGSSAESEPFAARPLELLFRVPDRGTLVVGIDDTGRTDGSGSAHGVVVQVRGMPRAITLPADHALARTFRSTTDNVLHDALQARGIVFSRADLDALPATTRRIRAYSLDATTLGAISRFSSLTTLDLSGCVAPAPTALRQLTACTRLRSLTLPNQGVGAAHIDAVVDLPELHELFFGAIWDLVYRPSVVTESELLDDGCAAILSRATRLTELSIPGTAFTDAGLASLARLPLRRLLIGSPEITGVGMRAFAGSTTLEGLSLIGCDRLDQRGLQELAAGPARRISLADCPITAEGIATLAAIPDLAELGLHDCHPNVEWPVLLKRLAMAGGPRKLELTVDAAMPLESLIRLAGATRLEKLEVSVLRDAPIRPSELDWIRAALPGVTLDVFDAPR